MPTRLLVADDEVDIRVLVGVRVRHLDVEVVEAADGEVALRFAADGEPPGVVVLDQRMPKCTGLEVARALRSSSPDLPVAIFSAFVDDELRRAADDLAVTVHSKSDLSGLVAWIEQQLQGART